MVECFEHEEDVSDRGKPGENPARYRHCVSVLPISQNTDREACVRKRRVTASATRRARAPSACLRSEYGLRDLPAREVAQPLFCCLSSAKRTYERRRKTVKEHASTRAGIAQRAWALLLAVALCLGLVPGAAWAAEGQTAAAGAENAQASAGTVTLTVTAGSKNDYGTGEVTYPTWCNKQYAPRRGAEDGPGRGPAPDTARAISAMEDLRGHRPWRRATSRLDTPRSPRTASTSTP